MFGKSFLGSRGITARGIKSWREKRGLAGVGFLGAGLLCCMGVGLISPPAFSKSSPSLRERLEEERSRLEALREQIRATQAQNEQAGQRERTLLKQVEQADRKLQLKRQELSVIDLQMRRNQEEMNTLEREIQDIQQEVEEKRGELRQRLRASYMEGKGAALHLLLQAKSGEDLDRRYRYLQWISKGEAALLKEYEKSLTDLRERNQEMSRIQEVYLGDYREKSSKVIEIEQDRIAKQQLLARLREEVSSRQGLLKELEESAASLQTLIRELQREKSQGSAPSGFAKEKGQLVWPSDGAVVTFFGKQKHPKFDTFVFKKGIEIDAKYGEPIRAVFDGVVVYADWFRGYGILIVLDHGENYYTLYAHAAKALVSVGDRVRRRQVIGEVGETGFTQESNLYFEIRHGGQPEDPLPWLKRR